MTVAAQPALRADRYDEFVRGMIKACKDPGQRAALRRGLGRPPEQAYTMHAIVARWLPERPWPATEFAYYGVAAMIAAQARPAERERERLDEDTGERPADDEWRIRKNLGVSVAWGAIRPDQDRRAVSKDTAEKRLHLLVRQGLPGVHQHLPGLVRHLRQLRVPVDWSQLIDDLSDWTRARDRVAKRWLQDFYRNLPTDPKE